MNIEKFWALFVGGYDGKNSFVPMFAYGNREACEAASIKIYGETRDCYGHVRNVYQVYGVAVPGDKMIVLGKVDEAIPFTAE